MGQTSTIGEFRGLVSFLYDFFQDHKSKGIHLSDMKHSLRKQCEKNGVQFNGPLQDAYMANDGFSLFSMYQNVITFEELIQETTNHLPIYWKYMVKSYDFPDFVDRSISRLLAGHDHFMVKLKAVACDEWNNPQNNKTNVIFPISVKYPSTYVDEKGDNVIILNHGEESTMFFYIHLQDLDLGITFKHCRDGEDYMETKFSHTVRILKKDVQQGDKGMSHGEVDDISSLSFLYDGIWSSKYINFKDHEVDSKQEFSSTFRLQLDEGHNSLNQFLQKICKLDQRLKQRIAVLTRVLYRKSIDCGKATCVQYVSLNIICHDNLLHDQESNTWFFSLIDINFAKNQKKLSISFGNHVFLLKSIRIAHSYAISFYFQNEKYSDIIFSLSSGYQKNSNHADNVHVFEKNQLDIPLYDFISLSNPLNLSFITDSLVIQRYLKRFIVLKRLNVKGFWNGIDEKSHFDIIIPKNQNNFKIMKFHIENHPLISNRLNSIVLKIVNEKVEQQSHFSILLNDLEIIIDYCKVSKIGQEKEQSMSDELVQAQVENDKTWSSVSFSEFLKINKTKNDNHAPSIHIMKPQSFTLNSEKHNNYSKFLKFCDNFCIHSASATFNETDGVIVVKFNFLQISSRSHENSTATMPYESKYRAELRIDLKIPDIGSCLNAWIEEDTNDNLKHYPFPFSPISLDVIWGSYQQKYQTRCNLLEMKKRYNTPFGDISIQCNS